MQVKTEVTEQLRTLIGGTFFTEDAMALIRAGANPDIRDEFGDSLLHILIQEENNIDGCNDTYIEELVTQHHFNIDTQNGRGFTPLQSVINNPFDTEEAMKLVRLGANPETKDDKGISLLNILSMENNQNGTNNAAVAELEQLIINRREEQHVAKNNFLNLLVLLVRERNNKRAVTECSHFKSLPLEIIHHIISFLDFKSMGKTPEEGVQLTSAAFRKHWKLNRMIAKPGGINVFQENKTFTFFKSVNTLCLDYEKLQSDLIAKQTLSYKDKLQEKKLTILSEKTLAQFTQSFAIPYWRQHASLFKEIDSKQELLDNIKDSELYDKPDIRSRLKF